MFTVARGYASVSMTGYTDCNTCSYLTGGRNGVTAITYGVKTMTKITIITKAQYTVRNTYFRSVGGKLLQYAIETALYNYDQMLKGNYAAFGVTNSAMMGYAPTKRAYADRIATLVREYGVKFNKETGLTSKASNVKTQPVSIEEFNTLLIDALTATKAKSNEFTLAKAQKSFDSLLTRVTDKLSTEDAGKFLTGAIELLKLNMTDAEREREQNAQEQAAIEAAAVLEAESTPLETLADAMPVTASKAA